MLLDYCIGRAAVKVKEFYILPVGDKLIQYDTIAEAAGTGTCPKPAWLSAHPPLSTRKSTEPSA